MTKPSAADFDEPPLQRGGAANQGLVKLRDQIMQGTLARGTKLPSERELAQRYQASAPTIREATRGLAAVRLVEVRRRLWKLPALCKNSSASWPMPRTMS